jgi:prophage regulatory protein
MEYMRLIRLASVIDKVGLKKSKIYDLIKNDKFPRPTKISGASAWLDTEIDNWIIQQVAASRG